MENEAWKKLNEFFNIRNEMKPHESYELLRLFFGILARERRCGEAARGAYRSESGLEDLVNMLFICNEMIAVEKAHIGCENSHVALELNVNASQLFSAFFFYGLGAALHGDIELLKKKPEDLKREERDFVRIVRRFPRNSLVYYKQAFAISIEREWAFVNGEPINKVTLEGQFFWGVRVRRFLEKFFYEERCDKSGSVSTLCALKKDIDFLSSVFISFRQKVEPMRHMMERL